MIHDWVLNAIGWKRPPVGKKKTHFNDFQELFWPIYAADRELLQ